jgi:hypothetical protein
LTGQRPHWEELTTLILVAGHAVYVADNFEEPSSDDNWFLQSFQKGEPPFYIEGNVSDLHFGSDVCHTGILS